jgi:hypothetical protein
LILKGHSPYGGLAEWLIASVLKTDNGASPTVHPFEPDTRRFFENGAEKVTGHPYQVGSASGSIPLSSTPKTFQRTNNRAVPIASLTRR